MFEDNNITYSEYTIGNYEYISYETQEYRENIDKLRYSKGWHLMGTESDVIDLRNLGDFDFYWTFNDGSWKVVSNNEDLKNTLETLGYETFDKEEAFTGYWGYNISDHNYKYNMPTYN